MSLPLALAFRRAHNLNTPEPSVSAHPSPRSVLLTISRPAGLAKTRLMRPTALPIVHRWLGGNARPLLQAVRDPLNITVLVKSQNPQFVAVLAALLVHDGIVAVVVKPPDDDSD